MGSSPPCPIIPTPKIMALAPAARAWPRLRVEAEGPGPSTHVARFTALADTVAQLYGGGDWPGGEATPAPLPLRLTDTDDRRPEGYTIDLGAAGIHVAAPDDAGFRHAATTLAALLARDRMPQGRIEDWPRLAIRGLHLNFQSYSRLDVDRALQVMETAVGLKLNTLLVEYGGRFPYAARAVPSAAGSLSRDDVRRLGEAAAAHGLRVIPLQQSMAHLEYLLGHPTFADLRESPERDNLICPSNPRSLDLIQTLVGDLIDAHPHSEWIHLGGDEARKIGQCPACATVVSGEGVGGVYGRFMGALARQALERGKRPILWDDTLCAHPDALPHLPNETIIAYWDYIAVSDPTPVVIPRMAHAQGGPRVAHHWAWLAPRRRRQISDVQADVMQAYSKPCNLKSALGDAYLREFGRYLGERFPTWLRALPYLEYYRDKGHDVLCCPTGMGNGDTLDGVPNYARFEENIRTHGDRATAGGALGMVTTHWYDLPPEVLVQSMIHTAQHGW